MTLDPSDLPNFIKRYHPFMQMRFDERILMASKMTQKDVCEGDCVLDIGSDDSTEYFLVEGALLLVARDGRSQKVIEGDPSALKSLARLRPSQYKIVAESQASLLCMPTNTSLNKSQIKASAYEVEMLEEPSHFIAHSHFNKQPLFVSFKAALDEGNIVLPSLPDIAFEVRTLLEKPGVSIEEIASAVSKDPAICTKLIRAANSPLYKRVGGHKTIKGALVCLGLNTTKQLVLNFAIKEVFQAKNRSIQTMMKLTWLHTLEVAAKSYMLSKDEPELDADHALLAGLVHDIGSIPIITFADQNPALIDGAKDIMSTIRLSAAEMGAMILEKWGFDEDLIEVALNKGNYDYDHFGNINYCDIALVAQYIVGREHHTEEAELTVRHSSVLRRFQAENASGLNIVDGIGKKNEDARDVRDLFN